MANNTLRVLIDRVQELTNRVDPKYRGRVLAALSRAVEYWAEKLPWPSLRREETFLSNGTQYLTFPDRVRSIITITDQTNGLPVAVGTGWDKRSTATYTDKQGTGTPYEWRDVGYEAVIAQPSTDTVLQVRAGASEALEVRVAGLIRDTAASGSPMELQHTEEILTMGGTNATNTSQAYVEIFSIEKTENTTTYIKVTDPVSGALLTYLRPQEARAQFRRVQFLGVPAAGQKFLVEYYRKPPQLVSEDQAIDPSVDLDFLLWRAAGDMHWIAKSQGAAQKAWEKADEYLAARIDAEETHGERPNQTVPGYSYFGAENTDFGTDTEFGSY